MSDSKELYAKALAAEKREAWDSMPQKWRNWWLHDQGSEEAAIEAFWKRRLTITKGLAGKVRPGVEAMPYVCEEAQRMEVAINKLCRYSCLGSELECVDCPVARWSERAKKNLEKTNETR